MKIYYPFQFQYTPDPEPSVISNKRYCYNKCNTESDHSPLNDPLKNVYLLMDQKKARSTKKVYPFLSTGNNVELPDYMKLPQLPPNKMSLEHVPKYHICKKSFGNKYNNQCETVKSCDILFHSRKRKFPNVSQINMKMEEYQPNVNYIRNKDQFLREYNRKYNVRSFDIISNNNYIPYENVPIPEKNYFSNLIKSTTPRTSRDEVRRDLINRYKLLNGVGIQQFFKENPNLKRWKM